MSTYALGQIGNPSVIEPLMTVLADEDEGVRAFAQGALEKPRQKYKV